MNWDAMSAIGEVTGAVAVIFTLVYLARQIRQSNVASNATAIQTFFNSMESMSSQLISEPQLRDVFSRSMVEWE